MAAARPYPVPRSQNITPHPVQQNLASPHKANPNHHIQHMQQQQQQKYQYKPIIALDMNSIPVMFQGPAFQSLISTPASLNGSLGMGLFGQNHQAKKGPVAVGMPAAPKKIPAPAAAPQVENILLMIAPQQQLNSQRRRRSQPKGPKATGLIHEVMRPFAQVQRPRAASEPMTLDFSHYNLQGQSQQMLIESTPVGLRTDQQLADFKRRKLMQHAYNQLEVMVPSKYYAGKPSRANVLLGAIAYLGHMQSQVAKMEAGGQPQKHQKEI